RATKYGVCNIRPEKTYRFIYPFKAPTLLNLGYYLEFDYLEEVKPSRSFDPELAEAVECWKQLAVQGDQYLHCLEFSPLSLLIEDRRAGATTSRLILKDAQKEIYQFCDQIHSFPAIFSHVRRRCADLPIRRRDVQDFLDDMVALGLM